MNLVKDKSFVFASRVVKLVKYPEGRKKEFVLSKQVSVRVLNPSEAVMKNC